MPAERVLAASVPPIATNSHHFLALKSLRMSRAAGERGAERPFHFKSRPQQKDPVRWLEHRTGSLGAVRQGGLAQSDHSSETHFGNV